MFYYFIVNNNYYIVSMSKVVALYRMCEDTNKNNEHKKNGIHLKHKHNYINNKNCINNFKRYFDGELIVFGDRLDKSKKHTQSIADKFIETKGHGNHETFNEALDYALSLKSDTIVYFVEDDYIHRGDVQNIILEGLDRFDYVTLYDHPDKHGTLDTKLITTKSTHWIKTHSTTMTFATRVNTLVFNEEIFRNHSKNFIYDHQLWLELGKWGKTLGSTIPAFATHGEINWTSPVINWKNYV